MYGDQLIKNILASYLKKEKFEVRGIIKHGFELDFRDASMTTEELIRWIKSYEPETEPIFGRIRGKVFRGSTQSQKGNPKEK